MSANEIAPDFRSPERRAKGRIASAMHPCAQRRGRSKRPAGCSGCCSGNPQSHASPPHAIICDVARCGRLDGCRRAPIAPPASVLVRRVLDAAQQIVNASYTIICGSKSQCREVKSDVVGEACRHDQSVAPAARVALRAGGGAGAHPAADAGGVRRFPPRRPDLRARLAVADLSAVPRRRLRLVSAGRGAVAMARPRAALLLRAHRRASRGDARGGGAYGGVLPGRRRGASRPRR